MTNLKTTTSIVLPTLATLAVITLSACGPAKWQESRGRFTGDPVAETQVTDTRATDLSRGGTAYVNPERLKGLETPDSDPEESETVLDQGTEVEIVDATPQGADDLVKVKLRASPEDNEPAKTIYIPPRFISTKPIQKKADRYFVIENIATEKLRVYERCATSADCPHKLVFETDMVAGEDTLDHSRRSRVGNFVIDSWTKFYEDVNRNNPSWLVAKAPTLPAPGASLEDWVSETLIPEGYKTKEPRAAFGWFTAKIRPNASEQWTHGTWGHGADGDKFIKAVKASSDLRVMSHGCTRVENRAIALMHEMLPAGTKLIKVYAKEAVANTEIAQAQTRSQPWDWVLTTEGARKSGPAMSAKAVEARKVRSTSILEKGTYVPKQVATAVSGNLYKLDDTEFRGTLFVDEGRLDQYEHPVSMIKGGYQDKGAMPKIVKAPKKSRKLADK